MRTKIIVKEDNYLEYMQMICDRYNIKVIETEEPTKVWLQGTFEDTEKFLQDLNERFAFSVLADGTYEVTRPLKCDSLDDLKLLSPKELFGFKLYYISAEKDLKKLKLEESLYSKIKHISLYPSVEQCIQSVKEFDDKKEFYIYVPKTTLLKQKICKADRPSSNTSININEYWCLNELEVEPLYKIKVLNDFDTTDMKYGTVYNYKITDVFEVDGNNLLEEYAILNEVKYKESHTNGISYWLEFKDYKEARHFYKLCLKEFDGAFINWIDNNVYYTIH